MQIEQFIESIYPTQDPKKLALIAKNQTSEELAKKKGEDAEAKKDMFFLLLAVLGTLLFISAMMVISPFSPFEIPY